MMRGIIFSLAVFFLVFSVFGAVKSSRSSTKGSVSPSVSSSPSPSPSTVISPSPSPSASPVPCPSDKPNKATCSYVPWAGSVSVGCQYVLDYLETPHEDPPENTDTIIRCAFDARCDLSGETNDCPSGTMAAKQCSSISKPYAAPLANFFYSDMASCEAFLSDSGRLSRARDVCNIYRTVWLEGGKTSCPDKSVCIKCTRIPTPTPSDPTRD
jgi:hypothetical protein